MNKTQMAAKLYDTRDTMKRFWGDKYQAKVDEYRPYIEQEAKLHDGNVLSAMVALMNRLQSAGEHAMAGAMVMATAVEIIEG